MSALGLLCRIRPHRPTVQYRWVTVCGVTAYRPVWYCGRCRQALAVEVPDGRRGR